VPDFVVIVDNRILVLDKRCTVGSHLRERAMIDPENALDMAVGTVAL